MWVKFKKDWSDGYGNFVQGQVIELSSKTKKNGEVVPGTRADHYIYRNLIEYPVEAPKPKKPKRAGKFVEIIFTVAVANSEEEFKPGVRYSVDEFRAKKFIERGQAMPAGNMIQSGTDKRPRERRAQEA